MERPFEYYVKTKSNIQQKIKSDIQYIYAIYITKCTKNLIKSDFYFISEAMDKFEKYDRIIVYK